VSDSNVIRLAQPGAFADHLTEILLSGARALLTQAVEAEVASFSQNVPISRPRRASSASCVTAIFRNRDHDRHRPGRGPPAASA
jgi:hypothetical protein